MTALNEFKIPFVGLAIGKHTYSYNVKDRFFKCFETSEVKTGSLKCELILEKKSDMLVLDFSIEGYVDLDCDLCLSDYPQDVSIINRLIVKFGQEYQEQSDEIIVIPVSQQEISVAQYIYEYIHLGLPVKRVHPGGIGDRMNCNAEIIEKLKSLVKTGSQKNKENKKPDARWDELKKIKFD